MAEIVRGKTDETAERDNESPSKSCEEVGNLSWGIGEIYKDVK